MWNIIFYEKEDGTIPVKEFLDALPTKHLAKAFRDIDVLEEYGTSLTEPHTKHIRGKLWGLRIRACFKTPTDAICGSFPPFPRWFPLK